MSGDRFSVRTPVDAGAEIRELADRLGLRLGQFCTMALILGARQLGRAYSPERYTIPAVLEVYKTAGVITEETMEKALQGVLLGVFENPELLENILAAAEAHPEVAGTLDEESQQETED